MATQSEAGNNNQNHAEIVAQEEALEPTVGVRQGDPNEARYFGPSGVSDTGFGTGQGDYGTSDYSVGAPVQNNDYHPGYGVVPGYGALGTGGDKVNIPEQYHDKQPVISRDERIHQDVVHKLATHAELANTSLEVEVINSIVTVRGSVASEEIKRLIYAVIEPMREVRDVVNLVELENK